MKPEFDHDTKNKFSYRSETTHKVRGYMNWSGGKDSALSLYKTLLSKKYDISCLLTTVNAAHDRISMHGVRRNLLKAQASSIGIPLKTVELPEQPSMDEYEQAMINKINELKSSGCSCAIFGDIFLEDLRKYRERKLKEAGMECIFPLWKQDTKSLIKEFLALGFKSIIVCVNEQWLDKSFCGRIIDENFLSDLPPGVDPCGENGEFHSYVFEGPLFSYPVQIIKGDIVYRKYEAPKNSTSDSQKKHEQYGFYFCDLLEAS